MGAIYTFVLVACVAHHPGCSEKHARRVMRSAPMGLFACDVKLEIFKDRLLPKQRGMYRARCEQSEANRA